MAGWFSNKPFKRLIMEKDDNLGHLKTDQFKTIQVNSPAWKELQNGPSRVKKLSKVFEDKTSTYNEKTNWWLEERQSVCESPTSKKTRGVKDSDSPRNSPGKFMTKLERIVAELLQKELSYVHALERGIDYYVSVIRKGDEGVPAELCHQTFKLFGNIEEICKLHKESIYPRLLVCNGNAKLIADTITSLVQNDVFYCYIIYAVNQKFSDQLISYNQPFFESLRSMSEDLLGVHSFIIQPIQKLPRYKMFFDEMIKELSKDVVINKETIAACCIAEKSVQRLLTRLNEALAINSIIEINEYGVSVQMSILRSMQTNFGVKINEPMMILVPKTSSSFPFRSPFNVYDLGKFIKAATFKAHEVSGPRTFTSKVFLFEKCLLYSKIINESTLGYRNHFSFRSGFAFTTKESQASFRVCGSNKKQDVIFSSNYIESIAEMKRLINQFYDPRRSNDSAFVDGNELMICEDQDIADFEDWVVTDCASKSKNVSGESSHAP